MSGEHRDATEGSAFRRERVAERLDRVLALARGEADGLEAVFVGQEANHLRLAGAAVVQAADVVQGRITVRAIARGREARGTTSDLTDEGLKACVDEALERARSAPEPEEAAALPTPVEVPAAPAHALDPATARLDAAEKGRWLEEALRAHRKDDLDLAGRFHTGLLTFAVRSSAGVDAWHRGTWSDLALSALERPAGHRASAYRARMDAAIDEATVQDLQDEVRHECRRARDPVAVDPGAWDVVLAPAAVADLLGWLGTIAFGSRVWDDGTSFARGRVGERVTGDAISVVDDASMPRAVGVPLPFDTEGQPKRRVSLVEGGVARGIVHDTRSARRARCGSTGHAHLGGELAGTGSLAGHLHLEPGDATPEELIARLDRGLLVTRLHYVNGMIEPRRAVMTGLLRDAAFLVEGGRIGRAVEPMRFTDSLLEALARVPGRAGISRSLEAQASWFDPMTCTVAPWVLVPGLRFTSGR